MNKISKYSMPKLLLPIPHRAEQLLPHKKRMCCIDNLIALHDQEAVAEVFLHPEHILLNGEGMLDRCGFIELAAQTAGVLHAAKMDPSGAAPRLAMLTGVQNFIVHADAFAGDKLNIYVSIIGEIVDMSSLLFSIGRGDELLAEGRLKVFMPESESIMPN